MNLFLDLRISNFSPYEDVHSWAIKCTIYHVVDTYSEPSQININSWTSGLIDYNALL